MNLPVGSPLRICQVIPLWTIKYDPKVVNDFVKLTPDEQWQVLNHIGSNVRFYSDPCRVGSAYNCSSGVYWVYKTQGINIFTLIDEKAHIISVVRVERAADD